jgi:hypothetical protein
MRTIDEELADLRWAPARRASSTTPHFAASTTKCCYASSDCSRSTRSPPRKPAPGAPRDAAPDSASRSPRSSNSARSRSPTARPPICSCSHATAPSGTPPSPTPDNSSSPNCPVRTHRNADKAGTYRWYNDYRLPDNLGGGTITIRLHATDDDAKRKFNRTENIRPIAASDPDFVRLYRRRNDAESINRALDDTLWLRRAHSVGHERQHLNLITHALGVNSLALRRHRTRTSDPPSLATAA